MMANNIQHTVSDANIIGWLVGIASSAVIFFLAWGLKDVKARYDKIPMLETKIALLEAEIANIKGRLV